jgi:hypothetical protein
MLEKCRTTLGKKCSDQGRSGNICPGRFVDSSDAVGWAKALARLFKREGLACAAPTRACATRIDADGGHGAGEFFIRVDVRQRLCPPYS